jgi:hypothetical protein
VVLPHPAAPQETDMTTDVRIAWRKLSLLELAQDLGSPRGAATVRSTQKLYKLYNLAHDRRLTKSIFTIN